MTGQVVLQVTGQVVLQVTGQVVLQVTGQVVLQVMHCQLLLTAPMMKEKLARFHLSANAGNYQKLTESSPARSVTESMGAVVHCIPIETRSISDDTVLIMSTS